MMNSSSASFPEFEFDPPKRFKWSAGLYAGIAAAVVGFLLLFLLLVWWYKKYHAGPPAPPAAAADLELQPPAATVIGPVGVDPSRRWRIPQLVFRTATMLPREQDMCVLCLSDFGDGDGISILPGCMHAFHTQCIDAYMDSFSTCPFCRSTITVELEEEESSTTVAEEEQL